QIVVVQACLADGDAADGDWLQHGAGRQDAGAPDIVGDTQQARRYFLGGEFISNRPTRVLAHDAKLLIDRVRVDLDHQAIGFVGQIVAPALEGVDVGQRVVKLVKVLDDVASGIE